MVSEMLCDNDGIVIGRAITPYCEVGARVLHIGILEDK